jgi:hypothetical protein
MFEAASCGLFHHQSEAQPPNGPLTAATSPDTPSHMLSQAVWSLTEFAELSEEVDPHVFKLRARRQSQHSPRAGGGSKESPGCAEAFKEAG